MKAKHRKIAAIASFATCMVATAWFIHELLWFAYYASIDDDDPLDLTGVIVFGAVMLVFLGLYLSFKRKRKMF